MLKRKQDAKKASKEKVEENKPQSYAQLIEELTDIHEKAEEALSRRIVLQLERDTLERLVKGTEQDLEAIRQRKIVSKSEIELKQKEHDKLIRSYMQRIKQLEYENRQNIERIKKEGNEELKQERNLHYNLVRTTQDANLGLEDEYARKQSEKIKEIVKTEEEFEKILQTTKSDFDTSLLKFEKLNENFLEDLKNELELKIKAELHDLEERKNCHINQLIKNHESDYDELKNFYNSITVENLSLIQAQREEIVSSHANHTLNLRKLAELRKKNLEFEKEKEDSEKSVNILSNAVKKCHKDKNSLQNLKIKLKTFETKTSELKIKRKELDKNFKNLLDEISEQKSEYSEEMKAALALNHPSIEKKNEEIENSKKVLESYQAKLSLQLGGKNGIMPSKELIEELENIEAVMNNKNEIIKRFQYLRFQSIRTFNESLKNYKDKLQMIGIDPQSMNFQLINEI